MTNFAGSFLQLAMAGGIYKARKEEERRQRELDDANRRAAQAEEELARLREGARPHACIVRFSDGSTAKRAIQPGCFLTHDALSGDISRAFPAKTPVSLYDVTTGLTYQL